jgi:hypothetical protein
MGKTYSTHGDKNACNNLVGDFERKRPPEDLGVDGKILLDWILGKEAGKGEWDSSGSEQGPVVGCCEHGNKSSRYTKGVEFLD